MAKQTKRIFEFGSFRLDPVERTLCHQDKVLPLAPKVFDTLLVLVENSGHLIEKDQFMKRVWPDTFVEEGNLTLNISTLRKILGENAIEHQYIETIPKRGYRFVATVRQLQDIDLVVEEHTRSRIITEEREEANSQDLSEIPVDKVLDISEARKRAGWQLNPVFAAILLTVLGVTIIVFYFWLSSKPKPTEPGSAVRSVAVLPFKPLGLGGNDEYLGLGMADALITRLSNIKQVVVRPTSSVLKYNASGQDPQAAGRELQVESVLDGKIQRVGDRIRITVQLVRARDGLPLWADKFDEQFTNVFSVQDSISERVAAALVLKLTGEEKKLLTRHYTEDSEAYQFYLKGRYHWNKRTDEGLQKGIDYFKQAVEQDPQYALAYAGMADCYVLLASVHYLAPMEAVTRGKAAAVKALQIDDTLAEAHTTLANIRTTYDWDHVGAEREYKRAIELNAAYATAHQRYSLYLMAMGRTEEGLAEIKRALELDPVSLSINTSLGWRFYFARQYEQAIDQYRKTLEMDPNFLPAHFHLGQAYEQKGMYEEAIVEFHKAISFSRGQTVAALGHAYAMSGKRREARKVLEQLEKLSKRRYVSPYGMVLIHTGLGEKDQAFAWLQRACEDRSVELCRLKVEPSLDSLRSDSRFRDLLGRIGLQH